jgi:hypothetical protein
VDIEKEMLSHASVILASQEVEIRRIGWLEASPGKWFTRPYLEKKITKRASGVAQGEKALSSNPQYQKKKENVVRSHLCVQYV